MLNENWLKFEPNYSRFDNALKSIKKAGDFRQQLQPRLHAAIQRFSELPHQPGIIRINCPENTLYRAELLAMLAACGQKKVIAPAYVNTQSLLGSVFIDNQGTTSYQTGLLDEADNGVLLLPVSQLMANPHLWPILKATVSGEPLAWHAADDKKHIAASPPRSLNVKLALYGDRTLMAELEHLEPDSYSPLWIYGEYEQDVVIEDSIIDAYTSMITHWCESLSIANIETADDWKALFRRGARECEDHDRLPLSPMWVVGLLKEASAESTSNRLDADAFSAAAEAADYRTAYMPNRALEDIHGGHVIIDCKGKEVGQVNGLTVVELAGHPRDYGEPARISCVVHFGDGDVADVERKADMAGNIHAKGMMIMQAFVSTALNLQQPLPYSASIVFEQSYCEVDGDSASLAELCAFVSALSQIEINQQIAVTGAVDQFGRVQAVGGINEKIEGFFHVCAHRGLTGEQGVILPQANVVNLCLNQEVLDAIKAGKFHLWPVEDVHQASPLLTGLPFDGKEDEDTLLNKIGQRIDESHLEEEHRRGWLSRLFF